jgi:hypothetical protein
LSVENFQKIKKIKIKNRLKLMEFPNVQGVGVGFKRVGGEFIDEMAVRVYVKKKIPLETLKNNQQIPEKIGEVPTDVIQIGTLRMQAHTFRARPAQGGDSVGDCYWPPLGWYTAGTLGGVFIDNTDGSEVILSNNHVLAGSDDVTINIANVGDDVVQPGTLDCGDCAGDEIADLKRWVQYDLYPNWNKVDAAIAKVRNSGDIENRIHDIGIPSGSRALTTDDVGVTNVQKSGRTTEYTQGLVFDIAFDTASIKTAQNHWIRFEDQILIQPLNNKPFSLNGDSGSLIFDMDNKRVGLLWGGSCDGWTVANHINEVYNQLNIRQPEPILGVCVPLMPCLSLAFITCKKEWGIIECLVQGIPECAKLVLGCPKITPVPDYMDRYAIINLEKIPKNMRRSMEKMFDEIRKFQKT